MPWSVVIIFFLLIVFVWLNNWLLDDDDDADDDESVWKHIWNGSIGLNEISWNTGFSALIYKLQVTLYKQKIKIFIW